MEIVLQNNLIHISTSFETLKASWVSIFLNEHTADMLFLPKSVLVFNNSVYHQSRITFLKNLSREYAKTHDLKREFYLRALLKFANQPIKIELETMQDREVVPVELYAYDSSTVIASLKAPNSWIMSYLRSQLEMYLVEARETSLVFDVSDMKAKARLERALNKRHILHYEIQYKYGTHFMQRLYSDFGGFAFEEEHEDEKIEEVIHYYTVLECPVGASQDSLKRSYKKLAKIYHPDKVHQENNDLVHRYTQKFQLLQEAYQALRIVE